MALYQPDGATFVPTEYTTGPWRPDAQHGGPPSALLGREIETHLADGETIARIGVELVRPVPLEPLRVRASREAVSRRVAHIDADLRHGDTVVARSRALVLVGEALTEPRWVPATDHDWAVAPPDAKVAPPDFAVGDAPVTYHQDAVEHRMTRGGFAEAGPATSWVRLLHPLVEGEVTSPLCHVLAAADFGSGISSIYWQSDGVGLINADLTIAFARPPRGHWVRVSSETVANDAGTGLCVTELGDEHGPIGVCTQSLLGLSF